MSSKNKNATYMTSYNTIEKPKAVTIIKDFPREFFEFSHKAFPSFFIFIPKLFIFYDIFSKKIYEIYYKDSYIFGSFKFFSNDLVFKAQYNIDVLSFKNNISKNI